MEKDKSLNRNVSKITMMVVSAGGVCDLATEIAFYVHLWLEVIVLGMWCDVCTLSTF